jgi:thiamine pyrophosphate-dependent acetolactate synthase large subunit-like protein
MSGEGTPIAKALVEPNRIRPAIERAFASGKPACVNVIMDQEPPGIMGGYEFM